MAPARKALAAVGLVPALLLTGCASGTQQQGGGGGGGAHAEPRAGAASMRPHKPNAVSVDIRIENGEVTPAGQRVNVTMGEPIELTVTSDQADAIHVHSQPEHEFEVKPGQPQEFTFTINRPGVYEVESHETGTVVVSLAVRP